MTRVRGFTVVGEDGTVYVSQVAAARALGCHPSTIRRHLDLYGNLSMIGEGFTPCEWRGQHLPTMTALSKASGISLQTICHHLKTHGNLDRLGIGKGGSRGNRSQSKLVKVGPCEWPSRIALAREMGVSPRSVSNWLSNRASPYQRQRLMAFAMQKSGAAEAAARARNEAEKAALDGKVTNVGRRAL